MTAYNSTQDQKNFSSQPVFQNNAKSGTNHDKNTNFLRRYYEIDRFGKECSYRYYMFIDSLTNPVLSRLAALAIPLSSLLSLSCKLLSDICRLMDTIVTSIQNRELAIGNIQTLAVDLVEYGRQIIGVLFGALVALWSPSLAAKSFLTNPVDEDVKYIDPVKSARLYSMADLLHRFFKKHDIDYRICCGTALGARREGGIIRNDDDIDLMLHPDSQETLQELIDNGTFTQETDISISAQPWTGGWQCFYDDCPKGIPGSPLEKIGQPFIDIFPGKLRIKGSKEVISYGEDRMYNLSRDDYFTQEEWGESPTLYSFGPTQLYGIQSIDAYLKRSYGPLSLEYTAVIYPHDRSSAPDNQKPLI
jgi:hypothetical protein